MADHHQQETEAASKGCGMLDFLKKKHDDKPMETTAMTDADKVCDHSEPVKETKEPQKDNDKPSLAEKLHRSDSSSSDEEEGEDGEKREKKKKGLKEKIKEKMSDHGKEDLDRPEDAKADEKEEKKGIMEKIKEKLPGGNHGKAEHETHHHDNDKDKKGFIDKIKEKLPGHHKGEDEKKET